MKTQRSAIVLHMHYLLIERGFFKENQIRSDLNISRSTFFRALSDFRCYLAENRPSEELLYDSENDSYRLMIYQPLH